MARKYKITKEFLERVAKKLEENLPRSEAWFRSIYERHGLKHSADRYNEPWFKRIPDVVNHEMKYVIEIDGCIHNKKSQIVRDRKKDRFYEKKLYKVFRVKAYDLASLDFTIEELCNYRESFSKNELIKKSKRVIIRRNVTNFVS